MKLITIIRNILKEAMVNSKGEFMDKADFAVIQGGFEGGKFIPLSKINVDEYIKFITSFKNFRSKREAEKVYKQIFQVYNQSALKTYNDKYNNGYLPEFDWSGGDGGFEEAGYEIYLTRDLHIHGIMNKYYYLPNTGFDDYIKQMRDTLGVKDDSKIDNKADEKFGEMDSLEDFESKAKLLKLNFIPQFEFAGELADEVNTFTGNRNFNTISKMYTKENLLHDLNEIGMYLLSMKEKGDDINLKDTEYTLYVIEPKVKGFFQREDGSEYTMDLGKSKDVMLVPDGKDYLDLLKSDNDRLETIFHPYWYIVGGDSTTDPEFENAANRYIDKTKKVPPTIFKTESPKIIKYKDHNIKRRYFNKLKNRVYWNYEENKI
jgi:hypothetical protein